MIVFLEKYTSKNNVIVHNIIWSLDANNIKTNWTKNTDIHKIQYTAYRATDIYCTT